MKQWFDKSLEINKLTFKVFRFDIIKGFLEESKTIGKPISLN
jgi:hypothetical protein